MSSRDVRIVCTRPYFLHCPKWTRCCAVRYRNADTVCNSIAPIAVTVHPAKCAQFVSCDCILLSCSTFLQPACDKNTWLYDVSVSVFRQTDFSPTLCAAFACFRPQVIQVSFVYVSMNTAAVTGCPAKCRLSTDNSAVLAVTKETPCMFVLCFKWQATNVLGQTEPSLVGTVEDIFRHRFSFKPFMRKEWREREENGQA